jgi:hypothetical protein
MAPFDFIAEERSLVSRSRRIGEQVRKLDSEPGDKMCVTRATFINVGND